MLFFKYRVKRALALNFWWGVYIYREREIEREKRGG
jgi:hypothetical protein